MLKYVSRTLSKSLSLGAVQHLMTPTQCPQGGSTFLDLYLCVCVRVCVCVCACVCWVFPFQLSSLLCKLVCLAWLLVAYLKEIFYVFWVVL